MLLTSSSDVERLFDLTGLLARHPHSSDDFTRNDCSLNCAVAVRRLIEFFSVLVYTDMPEREGDFAQRARGCATARESEIRGDTQDTRYASRNTVLYATTIQQHSYS